MFCESWIDDEREKTYLCGASGTVQADMAAPCRTLWLDRQWIPLVAVTLHEVMARASSGVDEGAGWPKGKRALKHADRIAPISCRC